MTHNDNVTTYENTDTRLHRGQSGEVGDALLTAREFEILVHVAAGWSAKEVARRVAIAPRTVERHIENIREKMRARNTVHMVSRAFAAGMLMPRQYAS